MAAALPFSTIEAKLVSLEQDRPRNLFPAGKSKELLEVKGWPPEIAGVFRGRELTRKERRLRCGITPIDNLIGGGIVRGRISEIVGIASAGKATIAASFAAAATRRGEVVAWIDASGNFDPASMAAAGVDLARMLWVAMPVTDRRRGSRALDEFERDGSGPPQMTEELVRGGRSMKRSAGAIVLKAAEWILTAGGFGLVVIDCGSAFNGRIAFTQSAALRLARGAERSGSAVLIIGSHRRCGTFAALSLTLSCTRASFSRTSRQAPALFDGLMVEARVMRNKLGGAGGVASWRALMDTSCAALPELAKRPARAFAASNSSAISQNRARAVTR
jgi:hypothetical protein